MNSRGDEPTLIESFLVVDHRATDLGAHVDRFTASVRDVLSDEIAATIPDALETLAVHIRGGRRFPRLEARPSGITWVDRPAPSTGIAHPVVAAVPDERTLPQLKGFDLPWLSEVARHGDVLLTRDGCVVETTVAGLVIVDDADNPSRAFTPAQPGLPSTTVAWFNRRVFPVEPAELTVNDVLTAAQDGRAVALNALHGPRILTTWEPCAPSIAMLRLVPQWRERWLADAETIR